MTEYQNEIQRRRTFAIISHPDAGKTTLTEKLLLYGGAIQLAGFVYGIMQFMFDGGIALGWQSIIGDYLLAYGALGFAGLAHGKKGGIFIGTVIGGLCRFLVHYVVGATVWGEYMPETFFGMTMHSPWFYSLLYNLAYMLPNILICLLVFALLWVPMRKYLTGADLKKA